MSLEQISHEMILLAIFSVIVIFILLLDLGIIQKKPHAITVKEASYWTLLWFTVSMSFAVVIYFFFKMYDNPDIAGEKVLEYTAGYLLEYSLSVDNLFVFIMLFQKFKVTPNYQPEILKWGILGAVFLRAVMIGMGAALVAEFNWVLYVFGVFLLYTALMMFIHKEDEEEDFKPEDKLIFKLTGKIFPISTKPHEGKFFTIVDGKRYATQLLIILALVESSDVMFALDSIPAVFSVSQDPIIVFTSNIFAILGLRSLFFMISGIMELFVYLKKGVSLILAFVGVKMLVPLLGKFINQPDLHISIGISLGVIIGVLAVSILASIPEYRRKKNQ